MNRGDAAGDGRRELTMAPWKSGILVRRRSPPPLSRRPHDAWNAGQFVDRRGNKDFGKPPIHRPRIVALQHRTSLIPTWLWYNVILMRVSSYLQEGSFLPCPLVNFFSLFFVSLYVQQQDDILHLLNLSSHPILPFRTMSSHLPEAFAEITCDF